MIDELSNEAMRRGREIEGLVELGIVRECDQTASTLGGGERLESLSRPSRFGGFELLQHTRVRTARRCRRLPSWWSRIPSPRPMDRLGQGWWSWRILGRRAIRTRTRILTRRRSLPPPTRAARSAS